MISNPIRNRRIRVACFAVAALGVFAGCGSSPKAGDDIASLGTVATTSGTDATDGTGGTGDSVPTSVDPQEAFTEYTKCMRDEGVDMPDPKVMTAGDASGTATGGPQTHIEISETAGTGDPGPITDGPNIDFDSDEYKAADKICKPILDDVMTPINIDPKVEAEQREKMLEFAKCMREQGIDFPDPKFSDNGSVSIGIGPGEGDPSEAPDQEEMEAATKACGDFMGGGFTIGAPAEES